MRDTSERPNIMKTGISKQGKEEERRNNNYFLSKIEEEKGSENI